MKLEDIINEEIQKLFEGSMSDAFLEKVFGMRNQSKEQNRQATIAADKETPPPPTSSKGDFAGDIVDDDELKEVVLSRVYANPLSLDDFEPNVRGYSEINGNLFLAQFEGKFLHKEIAYAVREMGKYKTVVRSDNPQDAVQWERIGETDMLGLSKTYWDYLESGMEYNSTFPERAKKFVSAVQQKNPTLKFIPMYSHYIKNGYYNVETGQLNKPRE